MKWVVAIDPYNDKSNGIKLMHKFCNDLNEIGEEAYLVFLGPIENVIDRKIFISYDKSLINSNLNTPPLPKKFLKNGWVDDFIVVYTEVLAGNPLKAKNIVRWIGNKQIFSSWRQFLSIEKEAFTLAHSKIFLENSNEVLYNSHIDEIFFEKDDILDHKDRNLDLIYHGKGADFTECKIYDNTFS